MNIAVIGTGYVGLVTGTCFAESGNSVICVDIDEKKVEQMKRGEVPIYEPNLDVLFERNLKQNRLSFTTDLEAGVKNSDIIFLALPTPPGNEGSADLSAILHVADQLGGMMDEYKIIIDKSTVPVGTSDKVQAAIQKNAKVEFDVVSNPEFLREGFAVADFTKPARVVLGTSSAKARDILQELYMPFVRQGNPILFMDERSAELTKYASNAFLACKITFMNEIANYCQLVGADVDLVRLGMGADDRIGRRFLFPGVGFGGSCFPKDVRALQNSGKEVGYDFKIIDAVLKVNSIQKTLLVKRVAEHFGEGLKGKRIALWGLAFKPDTDDIREAPSLEMIKMLLDEGATVCAYDPAAMENVKGIFGDSIEYAENQYDALKDADALVIATEWSVFRTPDFEKMAQQLTSKIIFDGRNLYDLNHIRKLGFHYESVGRETIKA